MSPPPSVGEGVRFEVEPVWGWRMYTVQSQGLLNGQAGHRWESPQYDAECEAMGFMGYGFYGPHKKRQPHHIENPDDCPSGIPCGIYMYKSPLHYEIRDRILNRNNNTVYAWCQAWGVIQECEWGYRAEHVRMETLYVQGKIKINEVYAQVPQVAYRSAQELYRLLWPYRNRGEAPRADATSPGRGARAAQGLNKGGKLNWLHAASITRHGLGWQHVA